MDMLSDGELFRMQQEAIERARETARRSPSYGGASLMPKPQKTVQKKDYQGGLPLKRITDLLNFKENDSLVLVGVIALLLADGCDDKLLIFALIFLLFKD